jgi:hypothetical protein
VADKEIRYVVENIQRTSEYRHDNLRRYNNTNKANNDNILDDNVNNANFHNQYSNNKMEVLDLQMGKHNVSNCNTDTAKRMKNNPRFGPA